LDHNSAALHHIRKIFPLLADANVKGGIFTGPQIRVMLASRDLEQTMTVVERNSWEAFRMVATYFLGKYKCENYEEIVESLIQHYEVLGYRMLVKLHYFHSNLEFFRPNLGDVSEEYGERFHQDIEAIEKRYQGRWDAAMMGDYIYDLVRADESSSQVKKHICCSFLNNC
jgi:hypothetical protein